MSDEFEETWLVDYTDGVGCTRSGNWENPEMEGRWGGGEDGNGNGMNGGNGHGICPGNGMAHKKEGQGKGEPNAKD